MFRILNSIYLLEEASSKINIYIKKIKLHFLYFLEITGQNLTKCDL